MQKVLIRLSLLVLAALLQLICLQSTPGYEASRAVTIIEAPIQEDLGGDAEDPSESDETLDVEVSVHLPLAWGLRTACHSDLAHFAGMAAGRAAAEAPDKPPRRSSSAPVGRIG